MKRSNLTAIVLALALTLTACSADEPDVVDTQIKNAPAASSIAEPSETPTVTDIEVTEEPEPTPTIDSRPLEQSETLFDSQVQEDVGRLIEAELARPLSEEFVDDEVGRNITLGESAKQFFSQSTHDSVKAALVKPETRQMSQTAGTLTYTYEGVQGESVIYSGETAEETAERVRQSLQNSYDALTPVQIVITVNIAEDGKSGILEIGMN